MCYALMHYVLMHYGLMHYLYYKKAWISVQVREMGCTYSSQFERKCALINYSESLLVW